MADRYKVPGPIEETPYGIPNVVSRMAPDLLRMLSAIPEAAADIMANYRPGPENEPLNEDIGRQGTTASMALSPGIVRAAGGAAAGELGIAAGRILQRADAQKLVREMKGKGATDTEIAGALNERFAPLLDEGAEVTKGIVVGHRQRSREFGALGGKPAAEAPRITVEDVQQMVSELGLSAEPRTAGTGTTYLRVRDPEGGVRGPVDVRVPPEGSPHGGAARQWQIDTSVEGTRKPHGNQLNMAGEPYDKNPEALRERLEYVFGRQPTSEPVRAAPEGGPINDPRQLRLLGSGIPVPQQPASVWDQFERVEAAP